MTIHWYHDNVIISTIQNESLLDFGTVEFMTIQSCRNSTVLCMVHASCSYYLTHLGSIGQPRKLEWVACLVNMAVGEKK